jgi:nucleoid DNA-binding protein
MDRRKLIAQVAEKSGYAKWEVNKITEVLLGSIVEAMEQGEDIRINNFGKFTLKYHKPKETLHPKTRQRIKIPEKVSIIFTQTRMFKPTDETIEALRTQSEK